jgi:hypothetical protein
MKMFQTSDSCFDAFSQRVPVSRFARKPYSKFAHRFVILNTTGLEKFLGQWVLDVATCVYEQGLPPKYESHHLRMEGDELIIDMNRTDADGQIHNLTFRTRVDGQRMPFNGGPLADEISAVLNGGSELSVSAWRAGIELMFAERRISDDGSQMDLYQQVNLPDGSSPSNEATFRRPQ